MGRYRAIMTDTDREYITGGDDVEEHKRYQAISRVRSRIKEELSTDKEILAEHHPELLEDLQEVVCDEDGAQMPFCKECGYEVVESSDVRGGYFCGECHAVLQEQDVRPRDSNNE